MSPPPSPCLPSPQNPSPTLAPLPPSCPAPPHLPQIKSTVLLMPSGSDRITSAPLQPLQSDKSLEDEEVKALLATRWVLAASRGSSRRRQQAAAAAAAGGGSSQAGARTAAHPVSCAVQLTQLRCVCACPWVAVCAACSLKTKKKKKKAGKEGTPMEA